MSRRRGGLGVLGGLVLMLADLLAGVLWVAGHVVALAALAAAAGAAGYLIGRRRGAKAARARLRDSALTDERSEL